MLPVTSCFINPFSRMLMARSSKEKEKVGEPALYASLSDLYLIGSGLDHLLII